MTALKRWVIALVIIGMLGGLLEIGLRTFMPSVIETGARLALRVPSESRVEADLPGSLALGALRWRIADVTVTAEDVPVTGEITSSATLKMDALPLIPTIGKMRGGTVEFEIPEDQVNGLASLVGSGLADRGEMRDGRMVLGGTLSTEQFDLPGSPAFELPYELTAELGVENGDITVTPTDTTIEGSGPVADFARQAVSEPRTVCIADRLPKGMVLSDIELPESGGVVLRADLSEWLFMSPGERMPGSCD
ncbi:LmeA family phospholipid-binding protein [Leucobacter sp. GX24907]